jgi:uncharacterized membrane protein YphA (DoxX/SURF4 family)
MASIFISGGLDAVQHPESKVKQAETVTRPLTSRLKALPDDTETLVRFNGALQVAAGSLLALGKVRRLAAFTLLGSLIPTTLAGHRFWDELDPERHAQQRTHFVKNLGLLGGLAMAATEAPTRHTKHVVQQTKDTVASPVSRIAALLHRRHA